MFTAVTYLIFAAFIVRTIRQISFQSYLWQLKEYRPDRILSFVKTDQGKHLLFHKLSLLKWVLFIFYYLSPWPYFIYSLFCFWLLWIMELYLALADIYWKKWRFPVFTGKSIFIIVTALSFQFIPVIFIHWSSPLLLAPLLDKSLVPIVAFTVIMFSFPQDVIKRIIFWQAGKKMKDLKNIKVIGITGSFGKTSTKYFLSKILSGKYNVAFSPKSYNTDIALALYILQNLNKQTDIFVAEMGAYKKGEINKICSFLKPDIGIITGIGTQHLELFGNQDNLIRAKFELIDNLSSAGIAIINSTNRKLGKYIIAAKKRISLLITVEKEKISRNVTVHKTDLQFELKLNSRYCCFKAGLAGEQNIDNLITAIITANYLGLPLSDLQNRVSGIIQPEETMQIVKSTQKLTLIDDTFNVNYEGVISGLDYLKNYQGLKVMILNPLIELGEKSSNLHRSIGNKAGNITDFIAVTNNNYFSDLENGIIASGNRKTKLLQMDKQAVNQILEAVKKDSVVYFAGKESKKWITSFK